MATSRAQCIWAILSLSGSLFISLEVNAQLPVATKLQLWLRADAGVTSDANGVNTWADQLAGDNVAADDVMQSTNANKPQLTAGAINGLPAVTFDGTNDRLIRATDGLGSGNPGATVFGVFTADNTDRFFGFGDADTGGGATYQFAGDSSWRYNNGNAVYNNDDITNTDPSIGLWRLPAGGTYGDGEFSLNGPLVAEQTSSTNPGNTVNLQDESVIVGAGHGGGNSLTNPNAFYEGGLAELIVYEGAVTDGDVARVGKYLQDKYALSSNFDTPEGVNLDSLQGISPIQTPADTTEGNVESDAGMSLFLERAGFELPSDIDVNLNSPGSHSTFDNDAGTIDAGTNVNSYFLSFDPVSDPSSPLTLSGLTVEFDEEILGIITANDELFASNPIVGAPGTIYEGTNAGLESGSDMIDISADLRSLTISTTVSAANLDQFRVITQAAAIPEPASIAIWSLIGLGLAGFGYYRLRQTR